LILKIDEHNGGLKMSEMESVGRPEETVKAEVNGAESKSSEKKTRVSTEKTGSKPERPGLPKAGRIRIPREGQRDLEFTGKVKAEVEEFHGEQVAHKKSRWTRLSVYSVEGHDDKYVAVVTYLSFSNFAPPVYQSKICSTQQELIELYGYGFLAKKLYAKMRLDSDLNFVEILN
jgi:hypothetical protein